MSSDSLLTEAEPWTWALVLSPFESGFREMYVLMYHQACHTGFIVNSVCTIRHAIESLTFVTPSQSIVMFQRSSWAEHKDVFVLPSPAYSWHISLSGVLSCVLRLLHWELKKLSHSEIFFWTPLNREFSAPPLQQLHPSVLLSTSLFVSLSFLSVYF